ncbi:MAG: DUF1700 domain-containing protein [Lachnospiraceae bacterium]|jgi:hypothetical protein|nr:DUF1700 domain-containing protein [Lachnospiraceae bacterium]
MNRTDFMTQLEYLLQSISPSEREEALQYYNDYFDDAGEENEQSVIEALGNPARVAENIKRDLPGSAGESPRAKVTASDRAVVEYGKTDSAEAKSYFEDETLLRKEPLTAGGTSGQGAAFDPGEDGRSGGSGSFIQNSRSGLEEGSGRGGISGRAGMAGMGESSDQGNGSGQAGMTGMGESSDQGNGSGRAAVSGFGETSGGNLGRKETSDYGGGAGKPGKSGMAGWLIVLIIIGLIFGSPVFIGVLSLLFGLLITWFAFIFAIGVAALCLFIVLVALLVVGIQCMFVDPLVGIALIGAGMVCGGIGILFLMLTVALTGIVTPAIFRGIGRLFRGFPRHDRKKEETV